MTVLESAIATLSSKWLGCNYSVGSLANPLLFSVGVSEVIFPTINVKYLEQKGLSTHTEYIPESVDYGQLILKAAVTRNNTLVRYIKRMVDVMEDRVAIADSASVLTTAGEGIISVDSGMQSRFNSVLDTIIIVQFANQNSIDAVTPVSVCVCEDVIPVSYSMPKADANSSDTMPLETITFNVSRFNRL